MVPANEPLHFAVIVVMATFLVGSGLCSGYGLARLVGFIDPGIGAFVGMLASIAILVSWFI